MRCYNGNDHYDGANEIPLPEMECLGAAQLTMDALPCTLVHRGGVIQEPIPEEFIKLIIIQHIASAVL